MKAARRRDVVFSIAEITATHVRATNDRGGEALYPPEHFEHAVSPLVAPPTPALTVESAPAIRPAKTALPAFELCDGLSVKPHRGEPIDLLLKRFKKVVDKAGIIREYRARQRFVPAPQRRHTKAQQARRRRGD
ncbi:MAG: 30S ribosomal protein S21 [Candidatus Cybelea sp.]